MAGSTRIRITSQEEYEWLDSVRQKYGLTWRGMMLKAEQRLLAAERHWPEEFQTPEYRYASDGEDVSIGVDGDSEDDRDVSAETDEVVG